VFSTHGDRPPPPPPPGGMNAFMNAVGGGHDVQRSAFRVWTHAPGQNNFTTAIVVPTILVIQLLYLTF